jgi:hypothetical protein
MIGESLIGESLQECAAIGATTVSIVKGLTKQENGRWQVRVRVRGTSIVVRGSVLSATIAQAYDKAIEARAAKMGIRA